MEMSPVGAYSIWLCVAYLVIHSLLLALGRQRPERLFQLLLANAALIAGFVFISLSDNLSLRLWSPILFFWWAYRWAGHTLSSIHPPEYSLDAKIVRLEDRFLGQPSLWWARGKQPWLTELMHFFYFTYYLYTPVLGVFLYLAGRFHEFESMTFAVLSAYATSYLFFAVTPTVGPRWALVESGLLENSEQRLEGYGFTWLINYIMYRGPALKGGAMPSSHSSTAVVFLVWCWRVWGVWGGAPALIVVAGMWFGSVYGRYHYVLDVLCGALLGLAAVWLADSLLLD